MAAPAAGHPHLCCPYCQAYEVDRMYLGTTRCDTCQCRACGADWDEERTGRSGRVGASASS